MIVGPIRNIEFQSILDLREVIQQLIWFINDQ